MPDLAALRRNSALLRFDYASATFEAYYRPADVGDRTDAARRAMAGGDMDALYAELAELVVAWDTTDDGHPVPTTAAGFRTAGAGVCVALWNALLSDIGNPTMASSPPTPIHSSNGSSPTGSSAPVPITTTSSSALNGPTYPRGSWPDFHTPAAAPSGSPGSAASDAP